MAWSSQDNLIQKITGGSANTGIQQNTFWFQKTVNTSVDATLGSWFCTLASSGVPCSVGFTGTPGKATRLTSSTPGAIPLLEGNVSPSVRTLLNMWAELLPSAVIGRSVILCDFLLYYPGCVVTGTPTTLDNTTTLPRYTDGVGVMVGAFVQNTTGAATPILTLSCSSSLGTLQSGTLSANANTRKPPTMFIGADGNPSLLLSGGNVGIKKINSYTIASGTTGNICFILYRPLAQIPIVAISTMSERDLLFQFPNLPVIQDGACLGFIVGSDFLTTSAANTPLIGNIRYGWS